MVIVIQRSRSRSSSRSMSPPILGSQAEACPPPPVLITQAPHWWPPLPMLGYPTTRHSRSLSPDAQKVTPIPPSPSSSQSSSHSQQSCADEPLLPPGERTKHPRFYFDDGNVIFLIKNTLYKVHRYFFQQHSPLFATMLSIPPPPGVSEGTDENPIQLEEVTSRDFDQVLSIFYPTDFLHYDPRTIKQWTGVLSVSMKWKFTALRELAIERLFPITSPVDKVVLGHLYGISAWLVPAYIELCTRNKPLNRKEGMRLGMDDVIRIGEVRYELFEMRSRSISRVPRGREDDTSIRRRVEKKFMLQVQIESQPLADRRTKRV